MQTDNLITKAAARTNTEISQWRMIGEAAVHVDVTPSKACRFLGPAILRGGVFHDGVFHGGDFHGGDWHRSPVFVQGTQSWVCETHDGNIASGCIRKPVEWWLENVERYAAEHGYSAEQQAEYREIFEFVASRMKALGEIKTTTGQEASDTTD